MNNSIVSAICISFLLFACSKDTGITEEIDEFASSYGTYKLTVLQSNDPSNLNDGTATSFNLIDELSCFEVYLVLKEDRTSESNGPALETAADIQTGALIHSCGPVGSRAGTWNILGNRVNLRGTSLLLKGNQLITEKDPNTEVFHRVVYTKQ